MAERPGHHVFHSLHEQLCQPGALLLRGKVVHPARGPGLHGPSVRGHGPGHGVQKEPAEQPEQPGQRERGRSHHAKGMMSQNSKKKTKN